MMDVVYTNRDGENPELRYSLRTLQNVTYDEVWIFGGAPSWVNPGMVNFHRRMQLGSPYSSTRAHIAAACNTKAVSDPFLLWNDDFYAMREIGEVPAMHRGSLSAMEERFSTVKTLWAKGLRETVSMIAKRGITDPLSYDLHAPLIIHKAPMLEALRWARESRTDAIHLRTLYGNLANLRGVETHDPKLTRKTDRFPVGPWLSSGDDTFRSTVEPVLRYLFPDPSPYEKG